MQEKIYDGRHSRTERLLGKSVVEKRRKSKIAVIGLGGVGSYVVEALARCGIEKFLLLDSDNVSESNINRQIIATYDTIGMAKTDVSANRIRSINPDAQIDCYQIFLCIYTIDSVDFTGCDYVVDAIDIITAKILLVEKAKSLNIPIICSMGTGNKLNPMAFEIADISKTSVCPLARVMRRELKARGISRVDVVFSKETPCVIEADSDGVPKNIPASVSFVPSAAGLLIASHIVRKIT